MNLTGTILLMSMSEINRNITLRASAMTVERLKPFKFVYTAARLQSEGERGAAGEVLGGLFN